MSDTDPHFDLRCNVYEATRSVYGYKMSWVGLSAMSEDELKREYESLCDASERAAQWEREWDEREAAERAYEDERAAYEQSINPEKELEWRDGAWYDPSLAFPNS